MLDVGETWGWFPKGIEGARPLDLALLRFTEVLTEVGAESQKCPSVSNSCFNWLHRSDQIIDRALEARRELFRSL